MIEIQRKNKYEGINLQRKNKYEEKLSNNSKEIIKQKNIHKISLRKKKNFLEIQKQRNYNLAHQKAQLNSNIKPEYKFKINKFEESHSLVFSYLNSNNDDLIKYCISEINIYFMFNCPNENEQTIINNNNLLSKLYILGNKFLEKKDISNLENILTILINIQFFEKGSPNYYEILYTEQYFGFYNKCLFLPKKYGIFNLVLKIIKLMIDNNNYFNLEILRSTFFTSLLNYISKEKEISQENKIIIIYIINYAVDISALDDLLKENDKLILNKCLIILINELYLADNENLALLIYEGIFNMSNFDDKFKFNDVIMNEGVILKILKFKFNKLIINPINIGIILYAVRILANNLTLSDKCCQLIYDHNIIDYYNIIINKFENNEKIIKAVFTGLANISVGKHKEVIKSSSIWEEKSIQKFCNFGNEIIISYIKIIMFYTFNSDYEKLKFIYNSKILHYFIILFNSPNINEFVSINIIKIINHYLSRFNKQLKQTEEYLIIYHKFSDLFQSSEKIYALNCIEDFKFIFNNIKNNYN